MSKAFLRNILTFVAISCFLFQIFFYSDSLFYQFVFIDSSHSIPSLTISDLLPKPLSDVDIIYIIPGGGSDDMHYPEWSKQRTLAAFKHSRSFQKKSSIFFALSAGSLNSANTAMGDGRIIFECQHMIKHLLSLGVERERIYGDFMSWDTVTNALVARQMVEGFLSAQKKMTLPLLIEVFISDFHLERVECAFTWVFGLKPSILGDKVLLTVHNVSSASLNGSAQHIFKARRHHELRGLRTMKSNMKIVKTIQELYAFVLLGPHKGFNNYFFGTYEKSKGYFNDESDRDQIQNSL